MKKLVLTTVFLAGNLHFLLASNDPAAQQLLTTAKQQARLFEDGAKPLQLEVDFLAQMKVPVQGHFTLKWEAKDRWWRRIAMADFQQTDIRNGDRLYTSRNINFTPIKVKQLISLLQFAEGSEGEVAKKQKNRVENGVAMSCLKVEEENSGGRAHEVCIDSASHEILSEEWQQTRDERRREQYSDYFDFQGRRYPRKLDLLVKGSTIITATVSSLTTMAFDEALLVPPKGAIERRQCAGMKHAVPIITPDPTYPTSARQHHMVGDTTAAITILTDGSVTNIQLIGSAARDMDEAALNTLKNWRFTPAMCGTEPVVSDIEVIVSFRLR